MTVAAELGPTPAEHRILRESAERRLAEAEWLFADAKGSLMWLEEHPPTPLAACGRHRVGTCVPTTVEGELCGHLDR